MTAHQDNRSTVRRLDPVEPERGAAGAMTQPFVAPARPADALKAATRSFRHAASGVRRRELRVEPRPSAIPSTGRGPLPSTVVCG